MHEPWEADYVDVDEDRRHHPLRNFLLFITGIWAAVYIAKALAAREEQLQQEIKRTTTSSSDAAGAEDVVDVIAAEQALDDDEDDDDDEDEEISVSDEVDLAPPEELIDDIDTADAVPDEAVADEAVADEDEGIGDMSAAEVEAEEEVVVAEAEKIEKKAALEIETLLASAEEPVDLDIDEAPAADVEPPSGETLEALAAELAEELEAVDEEPEPIEDLADDDETAVEAAEDVEEELSDDADVVLADLTDESLADTADDGDAVEKAPTWVQPIDGECPVGHPIKARFSTGRYHEPGDRGYEKVVPDCCYATVEEAVADGFTHSRWS